MCRKFPGVIHRETLHVKMRQEGEQLLRCALEGFQKQLGESHPQAGMRSCQLGNLACSDPKRWASLVFTKQGLPMANAATHPRNHGVADRMQIGDL